VSIENTRPTKSKRWVVSLGTAPIANNAVHIGYHNLELRVLWVSNGVEKFKKVAAK
jgi:hypothetical protein